MTDSIKEIGGPMAKFHDSKGRTSIASHGGASVAVEEPVHSNDLEDQQEVARLAYSYWLARGCPEGSPEADWLRAEQEVQQQHKSTAK
jgi:DUF2934 family protein